MLNNEQKYFLKKNKQKIGTFAAFIFLIIVIIIFIIVLNQKPTSDNEELIITNKEIELPSYLLSQTNNNLSLLSVEGEILATLDGNYELVRNTNMDEVLFSNNNIIYKPTIEATKNEDSSVSYNIFKNEIYKANSEFDTFIFDDNYIVLLSKVPNKKNEVQSSNKENKDKDLIQTEKNEDSKMIYYNVTIINRSDLSETNIKNISIDKCILLNDKLIYSTLTNGVHSYSITEEKEVASFYLGKSISDMTLLGNELVIFDTFGNGNNKSLILKTDDKLSINRVVKHDTPSIVAIGKEENIDKIVYLDTTKQPILYQLDVNGERDTKAKSNMNVVSDNKPYTYNTTMYARGYIYTCKDNDIKILDVKSGTLYKQLEIVSKNIFPIFEENSK